MVSKTWYRRELLEPGKECVQKPTSNITQGWKTECFLLKLGRNQKYFLSTSLFNIALNIDVFSQHSKARNGIIVPIAFLQKKKKKILKFICYRKKSQIGKRILTKKKSYHIHDIKTYNKGVYLQSKQFLISIQNSVILV